MQSVSPQVINNGSNCLSPPSCWQRQLCGSDTGALAHPLTRGEEHPGVIQSSGFVLSSEVVYLSVAVQVHSFVNFSKQALTPKSSVLVLRLAACTRNVISTCTWTFGFLNEEAKHADCLASLVKTAPALLLSKGKSKAAASLAGLKSGGSASFMGWCSLPEHKCSLWPSRQIRVKTGT